MPLNPHSSEFPHLVTAWLDETATPEEAAQLWQAVAESPACALEFAAAARFESLLAETVRERAVEKTTLRQVAAGRAKAHPPRTFNRFGSQRHLALAAALVVLGLAAWLLWPAAQSPQIAQLPPPKPKTAATPANRPQTTAADQALLQSPPRPEVAAAAGRALTDRLDRFFLSGVALDQVPLHEALGILQGQLQALNFLQAEALQKLRITFPKDVAGRRITFQSGPIAFLKALHAVAALGGCEVTVDEPGLVLALHRAVYSQVPERRDVRNILAGRLNADGTAAASDPARIAALMADAAALGINVDPNRPVDQQTFLPVTRGQWAALQVLADTREQLSQFPAPSFQLYISEGQSGESDRVIEEQEVAEMRANSGPSAGVVTPQIATWAGPSGTSPTLQPITVQPLGEVTQVTMNWATTPATTATTDVPAPTQTIVAVLRTGQGLTITGGANLAGSLTVMAMGDSASYHYAGITAVNSGTISRSGTNSTATITIIPVTNPPP